MIRAQHKLATMTWAMASSVAICTTATEPFTAKVVRQIALAAILLGIGLVAPIITLEKSLQIPEHPSGPSRSIRNC